MYEFPIRSIKQIIYLTDYGRNIKRNSDVQQIWFQLERHHDQLREEHIRKQVTPVFNGRIKQVDEVELGWMLDAFQKIHKNR